MPPSPEVERRIGAGWVLAGVLLLGLGLRIAHLIALRRSPFFTSLALDAGYYDAWAREIAGGAWIGQAAFWVDPLYAYLLGVIYRAAGYDLLWPRLVNLACGVATAALSAHLAWRVWRSRAAAALAAGASVLFVPALYFEGQSEKTAFTVVLVTAAVALFLRGTRRAVLAAGVVTGLAALARGNALLFAPLAAACLLLGWEHDPADGPAAPGRERARRATLFLAGMLPVVALATVHNWVAVGELVPTTTNLGVNLYLGNHAGNRYGYYTPPDFLRPNTGAELPDFRAEAKRRTGRDLNDAQLSDFWRGETWAAVAADPGLALRRTANKLHLALNDFEIPDNEDVAMVAEWSPVLRAPLLWMGQLLPFAVLGTVVGWRRRRVRVLCAVAAVYLASLLPFFIMSRLRIQVVPLLCVLAAGAVVWLMTAVQRRDARPLLGAAALLVPLLLFTHHQTDEMVGHRSGGLAIAWNNLGAQFTGSGQPEQAISAFEHAVAVKADAVPASLRALGDLYRQRGDLVRAERALRRLVELRPQSRSAHESLAQVYGLMVQDPRWRDDATLQARAKAFGAAPSTAAAPPAAVAPARAAMAQARTLASQGRPDEAIRVLQEAVRRGPYDEDLHYTLGETMVRHATPEEMVRFFSAEVAHDQKPQTSHYYWAVGLARGGDLDGAFAQLRQALEVDPAHEMSQRQWGLLLEQQGRMDEALERLLEATRIHPDFKAAWGDAARVADALGRAADADAYRRRAAAADPNSDRRFVHWARYLHEHGRDRAAWRELQNMLRAHPTDAEALALQAEIRPRLDAATLAELAAPAPTTAAGGGAAALAAAARGAFVARLAQQPGGSAWIAYDGRDAGAQRLARDLSAAFTEAGWHVPSVGPVGFNLRPGLFLFIAEEPSPTTVAVTEALTAAGLTHNAASGYREYSADRRRADPNWKGVDFAPDQEFAIVVGRRAEG